jgi:hypothetical protein
MTVGLLSFASAPSVTRILLIGYGQSNMGVFFTGGSGSPNIGTLFYNGTTTVAPPGQGIITLGNTLNNVTGLPVISLTGAVGGSAISDLIKGTGNYTNLLAQINAVKQAGDATVFLWDQGEGDAVNIQTTQAYKILLKQLAIDIATDIGKTTTTCPMVLMSLGTSGRWNTQNGGFTGLSINSGSVQQGTSDVSWWIIQKQQFEASVEQSHIACQTNIGVKRGDEYHYTANMDEMGNLAAQSALTFLGYRSALANLTVASAAVVDSTHTNINITPSVGTDITTLGGGSTNNGWEVSGDNGANWITATVARSAANQAQLTHSTLSTTNARKVRYMYGTYPPGMTTNFTVSGVASNLINYIATSASLPGSGNTQGDAYATLDRGQLWVFISGSFVNEGQIFTPNVANAAALPAAGNTTNDQYITLDTAHYYVFTSGAFVDSGLASSNNVVAGVWFPSGPNTAPTRQMTAPVNIIVDNSTLAVPLSPTAYPMRATGLSTLPMPTWRGFDQTTTSGLLQNIANISIGSENQRKFVVLGITQGGSGVGPTTPSTVKITPRDYAGNAVGSQVTATLVAGPQAYAYLYQADLGLAAASATTCSIDLDFGANQPFSTTFVTLWTVPFADLTSTTATAIHGTHTAATTSASCTVTASAGGFVIAMQYTTTLQFANYALVSGSTDPYSKDCERTNVLAASAANCAGTSSTFAVTDANSGDIDILLASWR